jgi:hypothetical protein
MRSQFGRLITTSIFLTFATVASPVAAADLGLIASPAAVGSCSELIVTCENGREYPLCPIAVSIAGEVITASLYTSPNSATHVRLIPMGVGYRYAGRGIWLDGFRGNALLNFGNRTQIACTIQHS